MAVFTSEPEFQIKAIGYLQAQLELNEAVNEELITFAPKLASSWTSSQPMHRHLIPAISPTTNRSSR